MVDRPWLVHPLEVSRWAGCFSWSLALQNKTWDTTQIQFYLQVFNGKDLHGTHVQAPNGVKISPSSPELSTSKAFLRWYLDTIKTLKHMSPLFCLRVPRLEVLINLVGITVQKVDWCLTVPPSICTCWVVQIYSGKDDQPPTICSINRSFTGKQVHIHQILSCARLVYFRILYKRLHDHTLTKSAFLRSVPCDFVP